MNSPSTRQFTIGILAKKAEVRVDTIRYYEREGLLPAPQRQAKGYRQYGSDAIERILFIKRAKELGFSLEEIRDLLTLKCDHEFGVERVKQHAEKRLAEFNDLIARMVEIRDRLANLVDACPGHGDPHECPILSSMDGGEKDAGSGTERPSCCGAKQGASSRSGRQ